MTQHQKYQSYAVLWDMDGVIVDTGEFHYLTWKAVLNQNGIPFTRRDFQHTFGMNNGQVLSFVLGHEPDPDQLQQMSDQKEQQFREMVKTGAKLHRGVLELLQGLHQEGIKQAVASSAPIENIDTVLDKFNIRSYFQAISSGNSLPSKPDPTVFKRASAELGIEPGNCIIVEDAVHGINAARRAGMKCIAVATSHPVEDLGEADISISSLDQISVDDFLRLFTQENCS